MQEVLRLLDAAERRRNRIVQQGKTGEHLERTVRRESGHDGLGERRVLDLQQQPAVRHLIRSHALDFGDPCTEPAENRVQALAVLFRQVLDDVGQVVPGLAQALLR